MKRAPTFFSKSCFDGPFDYSKSLVIAIDTNRRNAMDETGG
jgi:hypothetical protein